ncbi:MAG: zinc-binding dehydrogenase [Longimicrobiales bacterium]
MRAAIFHEQGGPEVIRIEDVPRPIPGPTEVLLQVHAASLNHLDLWVRRGLPIETPMPHIGGSDVAGEVVELGSGVTGVEPGARVVVDPSLPCGRCTWCGRGETSVCTDYRILGEHTQGGFAEFVAVPAANLYRVPPGTDLVRAAAAPLAFLTAWRALHTRARLAPGESVLITGASGGVATAAIQIAKRLNARVFAVTTGANMERVRALGADVVYDREQVDYARALWRDTEKRGVDVVLDSVGAATWQANLRCLARLGRLVVYGATTGPMGETDLRLLFWKQVQIIGTTMSTHAEFRAVMDLVFAGQLQPVVDSVMPLEEARAAHQRLEQGAQFGKIVLEP